MLANIIQALAHFLRMPAEDKPDHGSSSPSSGSGGGIQPARQQQEQQQQEPTTQPKRRKTLREILGKGGEEPAIKSMLEQVAQADQECRSQGNTRSEIRPSSSSRNTIISRAKEGETWPQRKANDKCEGMDAEVPAEVPRRSQK